MDSEVQENKDETWIDEARKYFDDASIDELDTILWCTCFPFGDLEQIQEQLKELSMKSNRNIIKAINIAHEEVHAAMYDVHMRELEDTIQPS